MDGLATNHVRVELGKPKCSGDIVVFEVELCMGVGDAEIVHINQQGTEGWPKGAAGFIVFIGEAIVRDTLAGKLEGAVVDKMVLFARLDQNTLWGIIDVWHKEAKVAVYCEYVLMCIPFVHSLADEVQVRLDGLMVAIMTVFCDLLSREVTI